jgi:hypothetical protein
LAFSAQPGHSESFYAPQKNDPLSLNHGQTRWHERQQGHSNRRLILIKASKNLSFRMIDSARRCVAIASRVKEFSVNYMRQITISREPWHWITRLVEFAMLFILLFAASAVAQTSEMYIYPAKGQDRNKQDEDRYDCHSWAVSQTGFDPSRPQASTPNPGNQPYRPSQPHVLRGGARGAALGAVGGAIAGDAGKGAAAGAAMGGLAGGFRRRDERRQQASQQQANAQAAQQNQQIAYNRAMGACLEGRGYTVK